MDSKKLPLCELCNVVYYSDKVKEEHLHGKKHLLAVHQANSVKVKEECGIFVNGLPNSFPQEELLGIFETYGKVTSSFFEENNRYCIVQFDNPEPVEQLVKLEGISFKGKRIKICRRTIKEREAARAVYAAPIENLDEINNSIKNLPTFNSQLKWLIDHIQPGYQETRNKIIALCQDLQQALEEEFPRCTIHPFGSTLTNLYLMSSDIDIYVQLYNNERNRDSLPNASLASIYVNRAKRILQKYGHVFSSLCAIPHAKTPIVKFVHNPTNFKCDFNFKNMLGVCNSRLIYYYLLLDHKLTPLMIFIKYWAKAHELIGLGGKFSNYGLALMFIFYMQQSEYNFPSVATLQTDSVIDMQDGWNGGFQRIQTYSRTLREHSIITVLQGFFEYYSKFDYTLNIICPYLGRTVPKTDFVSPSLLPSIFRLYTKNINEGKPPIKMESPICVQDPFELNHSVSVGVNADYLEEFVALCKISVTILQDPSLARAAMYKLLTEEAEVFSRKCVATDSECRFKIPLSSTLLQVNDIVALKQLPASEKQIKTVRLWQDELKATLFKVLKEIMRFTLSSDNENKPGEKAQRRSGQKDIHDIINCSFQCHGFYNFWDGHKTIMKDINIDKSVSLIDQQLVITKYILDILYKGEILTEKIIEFNINVKFNETPAEAMFFLRNVKSRAGYFKKFGIYFFKILPLLFQAHLIELLKELRENKKLASDDKP